MLQLGFELKVRKAKVLRILVRFGCPEIWKKKGSRVKRTRKSERRSRRRKLKKLYTEKIEKEKVEEIRRWGEPGCTAG